MNKRSLSIFFFIFLFAGLALAKKVGPIDAALNIPGMLSSPQFSNNIQIIISLGLISLVPFFLLSVTSFLRIIIVFSLLRTAIGTQQVPPNSVLVGLALFMTIFIMSPVIQEINTTAVIPYNQGRISQAKAFQNGMKPLSMFMLKQTREKDLALFVQFAKISPQKPLIRFQSMY